MKLSLRMTAALAAIVSLAFMVESQAHAQSNMPFVHPLFTNDMVLQRGVKDNVWGWTAPGQRVIVQIDGQKSAATAGSDGEWIAKVGPFAAGGPYTLTVSGPQTAAFSDVMIGDVWVCSGQSNMEFGVGREPNAAQIEAAANDSNLRIFTVAKALSPAPQQTTAGTWQPVTPDSIANQGTWNGFSAVAYFFGKDLQANLNVPIGLIQSSWGGTPAEGWTSKEALAKNLPEYDSQLSALPPPGQGSSDDASWYAKNDPGDSGHWESPTLDVFDWKPITLPQDFQLAGIPELTGINGVVWFRHTFDVPAADTGLPAVLHELVDDNDTTWVNGTLIGATKGYNTDRAYSIAASLLKPTGNVIVIRDLDTGGMGGVWGDPSTLNLSFPGGTNIPLAGQWLCKLAIPLTQATPYSAGTWSNASYPTLLFNGMISPITRFTIKGAIWYQGESNDQKALQYRTLLPTMITDWRTRWSEGNFPFLIVQLAGFTGGEGTWPEIRQAQWLASLNLPYTGIATAIDIGLPKDIHPTNKAEVGRRLALVAENLAYGESIPDSGPVYQSSTVEGSTIRLSFTHLDGGLAAANGAPLTGFQIAGADGNFVDADAKIDGNTVVVSSPNVPQPVAVQYAWSGYPACSLYNGIGLPAFPFKTNEK